MADQPPIEPPAPPAAPPPPNSAEMIRLQLENAMLRKGAKPGCALDDCLDSMVSRATRDPVSGRVSIGGLQLDVAVDSALAQRTHLLTAAAPNTVLQQAVKVGWDPARCMEPAYSMEWKKVDPKGHAAAVDAHLKAIMEKQRLAAQR